MIRQPGDLENRFELSGSDRTFSELLLQSNGLIGAQKVYQKGEPIRLCEGLLTDLSGTIAKVDRQYKRMQIIFVFDGVEHKVWTGYDVVVKPSSNEKIDNNLASDYLSNNL